MKMCGRARAVRNEGLDTTFSRPDYDNVSRLRSGRPLGCPRAPPGWALPMCSTSCGPSPWGASVGPLRLAPPPPRCGGARTSRSPRLRSGGAAYARGPRARPRRFQRGGAGPRDSWRASQQLAGKTFAQLAGDPPDAAQRLGAVQSCGCVTRRRWRRKGMGARGACRGKVVGAARSRCPRATPPPRPVSRPPTAARGCPGGVSPLCGLGCAALGRCALRCLSSPLRMPSACSCGRTTRTC